MKKISFIIALTALVLVSCNTGKGYTITGTVEGAADGDVVYLKERVNRQFVNLDSAIVAGGTFTMKGQQDSAVNRYLTYSKDNANLIMDFFLENGTIKIKLTSNHDSATGTPLNNKYQVFRDKMAEIDNNLSIKYNSLRDPDLSEENRAGLTEEVTRLNDRKIQVIKEEIEKNIDNKVGLYILGGYNYYLINDYKVLNEILNKVPVNLQDEELIISLKDLTAKAERVAVGQPFVDFEMATPDGGTMRLSDYAGKGKVVLVDFWASWCGPCIREMPNLVRAYADFKNKGFEIVGVSLDRDGDSWKKAIGNLNMTWPQMSDLKFWDSEGAKLYAVRSIPHVVLIDKNGTIIAKGLHGEELYNEIAQSVR